MIKYVFFSLPEFSLSQSTIHVSGVIFVLLKKPYNFIRTLDKLIHSINDIFWFDEFFKEKLVIRNFVIKRVKVNLISADNLKE